MAGGGGGNEPNLTPFIDLFSVLICFLLMSAAWIQLEVMPSNIEKATSSDAPAAEQPPPPLDDEKKVQLAVEMAPQMVVFKEDQKLIGVPYQANKMDAEAVKRVLQQWKERYPDKKDVVLNTEAQVMYGEMIKMYDLLVAGEFPDVGINPQ